jgi:hypothetical protein
MYSSNKQHRKCNSALSIPQISQLAIDDGIRFAGIKNIAVYKKYAAMMLYLFRPSLNIFYEGL